MRYALSVPEAAQLLSISESYVYDLVRDNVLPHVRLGRRIVIPTAGLEDYLKSATRGGSTA
jgi:excisionase family DNA binding protein